MLSEKQYFDAKLFLLVYKDALSCVEQSVRKTLHLDIQRKTYAQLQTCHVNKEILFDENGRLKEGENIKNSYYFRMFELVE
jgi:hypothetical protein